MMNNPSHQSPSAHSSPPARRTDFRRIRVSGTCVFMCFMGLLIWAKLRIAASIPRTVIAEPRHVEHGHAAKPTPPPDPQHAAVPQDSDKPHH